LEDEPEILAYAGHVNTKLADYAEQDEVIAEYRHSAFEFYEQVLEIDSNNSDVYLGLSRTTDDPDEQIEWLRKAARAGEPSSLRLGFLASALERRGTPESRLESLAVMREAYDQQDWGRHKWYLAAQTFGKYKLLERGAEAQDFLQIVREDAGFDDLLATLDSAELEPDAAVESLQMLCYEDLVVVTGADACITGVERMFAAALRSSDADISQRLILAALQHMRSAPYGSGASSGRVPGVVRWLERLLAAGFESAELDAARRRCNLDPVQAGNACLERNTITVR
jgi:hypothetical protein